MNTATPLRQVKRRFFDLRNPQAFFRLMTMLMIFAWLVAWLMIWPSTGDGDSTLHYLNLRSAAIEPKDGLTSWARPVYVLLMVFPAMSGLFTARIFSAFITILLVWQTMRLADDLKLKRASLAGWLLILQPLVFALGSDTMTEIPMALGLTIAIRWWLAKRFAASCLLMSFLPFVRPEGLLLAPVWALLLLLLPYDKEHPSFPARIAIGSLLSVGGICLIIACYFLAHDWLYYIHAWSWPLGLINRGPLWHHVTNWPYYCGPVLLVLFLMGIKPSLRREMTVPWIVWLVVFISHSFFYYFGLFGSVGFMRIMATTASITAVVCLEGWNTIAELTTIRQLSSSAQRAVATCALLIAALFAMISYYASPEHHHCFAAREAGAFLKDNPLLKSAPAFFVGDSIVLESVNYPAKSAQLVANKFDRREQLDLLAKLPVGTVGVWDDGQSLYWHHVRLEDFPALGYRTIYTARHQIKFFRGFATMFRFSPTQGTQTFIVVVKER